jgi:hypothetical protein
MGEGFVSPLNSTYPPAKGLDNSSHITTASLVYTRQTAPTPWPILAFSLGVSLLISLWGTVKSFLEYRDGNPSKPGIISVVLTSISGLYNAYRGIVAFVAVIQLITNHAGTGPPDIISVTGLLLCIVPYLYIAPFHVAETKEEKMVNRFAWSLSFLAFVSALATMCILIVKILDERSNKLSMYGLWELQGGNCPVPLGSDANISQFCPIPSKVLSCDQIANFTSDDDILGPTTLWDWQTTGSGNALALEQFAYAIINIVTVILAVGALFWHLYKKSGLRERFQLARDRRRKGDDRQRRIRLFDKEYREQEAQRTKGRNWLLLKTVPMLIIIIITAFALWVTVKEETNPHEIAIIDSSEQSNSTQSAGNGTVWADCFTIKPPSDKYGFLKFWWEDEHRDVASAIALL